MGYSEKKHTNSVVLCTYNGEEYIGKQLCSIINQTVPPDEIIICDDRSTDNTLAVVENLMMSTNIPIQTFNNECNLGSTKNFEKGIKLCRGDYIFLSDQDDIWFDEKIKTINTVFIENPEVDMVFTNGDLIDDNGELLGYKLWDATKFKKNEQKQFRNGRSLEVLVKHSIVTGATMAIRARNRDLLLPIPITWVHDSWITLLLSVCGIVEFIESPLIYYRHHKNQQIGVKNPEINNLYNDFNRIKKKSRELYAEEADKYNLLMERLVQYEQGVVKKKNIIYDPIEKKVEHLFKRSKPGSRWSRLPTILWELFNLNYFRYSNGFKSALRDFILS